MFWKLWAWSSSKIKKLSCWWWWWWWCPDWGGWGTSWSGPLWVQCWACDDDDAARRASHVQCWAGCCGVKTPCDHHSLEISAGKSMLRSRYWGEKMRIQKHYQYNQSRPVEDDSTSFYSRWIWSDAWPLLSSLNSFSHTALSLSLFRACAFKSNL